MFCTKICVCLRKFSVSAFEPIKMDKEAHHPEGRGYALLWSSSKVWRPFSWVHISKSQCISSQFSSSLKFCRQSTQERKRVKVHLCFVHSIILHRGHVLNHDLMRSQCQIWEGGCEKVTLHPEDHPLHQPTSQVLTCYSSFCIPPLHLWNFLLFPLGWPLWRECRGNVSANCYKSASAAGLH